MIVRTLFLSLCFVYQVQANDCNSALPISTITSTSISTSVSENSARLPAITGAAYNKEGVLLYCEYHYKTGNKRSVVEYRDSNETIIANKIVDMSSSLWAPNIEQNDLRHGEKIQVVREISADNVPFYKVSYRKGSNDLDTEALTEQSDQLMIAEPLVVDAGFDYAVRDRWDVLQQKSSTAFLFLTPARLSSISVAVRKQKNIARCLSGKQSQQLVERYDETNYVCYKVKPENTVISWFVPAISLIYSVDQQRLMYFSGPTNITDENARSQSAAIVYQYH